MLPWDEERRRIRTARETERRQKRAGAAKRLGGAGAAGTIDALVIEVIDKATPAAPDDDAFARLRAAFKADATGVSSSGSGGGDGLADRALDGLVEELSVTRSRYDHRRRRKVLMLLDELVRRSPRLRKRLFVEKLRAIAGNTILLPSVVSQLPQQTSSTSNSPVSRSDSQPIEEFLAPIPAVSPSRGDGLAMRADAAYFLAKWRRQYGGESAGGALTTFAAYLRRAKGGIDLDEAPRERPPIDVGLAPTSVEARLPRHVLDGLALWRSTIAPGIGRHLATMDAAYEEIFEAAFAPTPADEGGVRMGNVEDATGGMHGYVGQDFGVTVSLDEAVRLRETVSNSAALHRLCDAYAALVRLLARAAGAERLAALLVGTSEERAAATTLREARAAVDKFQRLRIEWRGEPASRVAKVKAESAGKSGVEGDEGDGSFDGDFETVYAASSYVAAVAKAARRRGDDVKDDAGSDDSGDSRRADVDSDSSDDERKDEEAALKKKNECLPIADDGSDDVVGGGVATQQRGRFRTVFDQTRVANTAGLDSHWCGEESVSRCHGVDDEGPPTSLPTASSVLRHEDVVDVDAEREREEAGRRRISRKRAAAPRCGALLPNNAGTCPRRDEFRCPLHGPIVARNEFGQVLPSLPADATRKTTKK